MGFNHREWLHPDVNLLEKHSLSFLSRVAHDFFQAGVVLKRGAYTPDFIDYSADVSSSGGYHGDDGSHRSLDA